MSVSRVEFELGPTHGMGQVVALQLERIAQIGPARPSAPGACLTSNLAPAPRSGRW